MAYIAPTANSTTLQLLATSDTFYLAEGLRINNAAAAIATANSTAIQISVVIDGSVNNATANTGAINMLGTDTGLTSGFSNSRVLVGQTGSVTSTTGDGIRMAGSATNVDNNGSISARQVGVVIFGAQTDILNTGSIYGVTNAIKVTGNTGSIVNDGSLRATAAAILYDGDTATIMNSGQVNATGDGVIVTGSNSFVANSGLIQTQEDGVAIVGGNARITNIGQVQSQTVGLGATGNSAQIINDGTVFGRTAAILMDAVSGIIRNSGLVSGFEGLIQTGDAGRITNSGTVSVTDTGMSVRGNDCIILNTFSGSVFTDAQSGGAVEMGVSNTATLQNAGEIASNGLAVNITEVGTAVPTVLRMTNTGTITGGTQALLVGVDVANIVNRGIMSGGLSAIANVQGLSAMTIVNEGTLRVDTTATTGIAILGNSGVDTLRNMGTVVGNVTLGDGADLVTNDSVIRGNVDLSFAADAYTGLAGRVTGTVLGGTGNDTLTGGASADVLDGGSENDALVGNGGNDTVFGRAGNDTISGGTGNDRMTSGAGIDVMAGGAGTDVFVFTSAATLGIGATRDQIGDFVHLSDDMEMIFMTSFIGNAAFTAAGQVRYVQSTGLLTGSTDADASAEWALLLVNKPVLTAADFVF